MRAYVPGSPADAAAFAGEPLVLPAEDGEPVLRCERIIQWYNLNGAFQTASYWKSGEGSCLVLEQVHRPSSIPEVDGFAGERVDLDDRRSAQLHAMPASDRSVGTVVLIEPLSNRRWLAYRASGMDRDAVLAIARNCIPRAG